MSDFYIHQQSTSNKPWCPSQHRLGLHRGVSPARRGRGQVYLFNWDGSPAPDAVRAALQAFLLFVWVAPFPRLQASKSKVSIWARVVSARRVSPRRPELPPTRFRTAAPSWSSALTHHSKENFLNFPPDFSTAKLSFNSFFKEFKTQLLETNGPSRKATPSEKTF